MSFESIQTSSSSTDLFQLRQETILGIHFEKDGNFGGKGYSWEFTSLTVQERSRTYEELHGASDCIDETPTLVENCLSQLDDELSRVAEKAAYDMAEQQNKAYVTDPKFRLMFLRAACFHPRKAAIRLVAFFEGKLRFFGRETLTRQLE